METLLAVFFFFFFADCTSSSYTDWDYDHMSEWSNEYSMCEAQDESPINIQTSSAQFDHEVCDSTFDWDINYSLQTFKILNNGHTISLKPVQKTYIADYDLDSTLRGHDGSQYMTLTQNENTIATLPNYFKPKSSPHDTFCLDSLHFHWGLTDNLGSEHTFDGDSYPLEVHFIHYSCQHASLGSTLEQFPTAQSVYDAMDDDVDTHQLAVIALLFDVAEDESNPAFDAIFSNNTFDHILYPAAHEDESDANYVEIIHELNLADLIPDDIDTAGYYAYEGSLTTPPCTDIVRWHVMNARGFIGKSQLENFRELMTSDEDTIAPNYREVQENVNTVYECSGLQDYDESTEEQYMSSGTAIIAASLGAIFVIGAVSMFIYKKREEMKEKKIANEKRAEINRNSLKQINHFYTEKAEEFIRQTSAGSAPDVNAGESNLRIPTDLGTFDI